MKLIDDPDMWREVAVPILNKLAKRMCSESLYWCYRENRTNIVSCLICQYKWPSHAGFAFELREHGYKHLEKSGLLPFL